MDVVVLETFIRLKRVYSCCKINFSANAKQSFIVSTQNQQYFNLKFVIKVNFY